MAAIPAMSRGWPMRPSGVSASIFVPVIESRAPLVAL
jgi:hypothetical protein